MSTLAMLAARKRLLGINDNTVHNIKAIRPFLIEQLDPIIDELYRHLLTFPECAKILTQSAIPMLKLKQKLHWVLMLDCKFDEPYATHTMQIGRIHFQRKVPPYIYIAAYSYVQCLIVARVSDHAHGKHDLATTLSSLSRIIMLDMDLALLAYTRAFWSGSTSDEDHSRDVYV